MSLKTPKKVTGKNPAVGVYICCIPPINKKTPKKPSCRKFQVPVSGRSSVDSRLSCFNWVPLAQHSSNWCWEGAKEPLMILNDHFHRYSPVGSIISWAMTKQPDCLGDLLGMTFPTRDYGINHETRIPSLTNQDSMENRGPQFFSWPQVVDWWKELYE